jgi:hypothetical protein
MNASGPDMLATWEAELAALVAEEARLRAQGSWLRGPHDLLGIIGRLRSEASHTDVLAWFLDPIGAHGLGTAPLEGLLKLIGRDVPGDDTLGWCRPAREVGIDRTIADLVIDGPDLRLVFEVKVDAPEQPRQAERLVHHFDTDEASFVFLTRSGTLPVTAGEHMDRWAAISWAQVLTLLDAVRSRLEPADRATATIDAYLASLRRIA